MSAVGFEFRRFNAIILNNYIFYLQYRVAVLRVFYSQGKIIGGVVENFRYNYPRIPIISLTINIIACLVVNVFRLLLHYDIFYKIEPKANYKYEQCNNFYL